MASHDAGEIASNLQPIGGPKAGFNLSQFGFLASGSDDRRLAPAHYENVGGRTQHLLVIGFRTIVR